MASTHWLLPCTSVMAISICWAGGGRFLRGGNRHRRHRSGGSATEIPGHVESPGAGERKHVLALRKHAEHQQLSLPAAGPKVENHWKISFLGWRVDGKQEV